MTGIEDWTPRRVVVLGGGIAALEAVLALHDVGKGDLELTLIAPHPRFEVPALRVATPFARGRQRALGLEDFMAEHGGRFRQDAASGVDARRHVVMCEGGAEEPYDALIVAVGAVARPAFEHVSTFGTDPGAFGGLLQDLEQGCSRSVAFVVPPGCSWPLPLYELALMTAEQVWGMGMDGVELHVVSPEAEPLEVFGTVAAETVASLLRRAGITFHGDASPSIVEAGRIDLGDAGHLACQRIVALPSLRGPGLEGLPTDGDGFVLVDDFNRVLKVPDAYAVGDAADHPVKQGGLACQQAGVAVRHLAAAFGYPVEVRPNDPVLRGRLLTGGRDRFLGAGSRPGSSVTADAPLWWPPSKVTGRYLAPYLEARGLIHLPLREREQTGGLAVGAVLTR